jgi:hypothetical protein
MLHRAWKCESSHQKLALFIIERTRDGPVGIGTRPRLDDLGIVARFWQNSNFFFTVFRPTMVWSRFQLLVRELVPRVKNAWSCISLPHTFSERDVKLSFLCVHFWREGGSKRTHSLKHAIAYLLLAEQQRADKCSAWIRLNLPEDWLIHLPLIRLVQVRKLSPEILFVSFRGFVQSVWANFWDCTVK